MDHIAEEWRARTLMAEGLLAECRGLLEQWIAIDSEADELAANADEHGLYSHTAALLEKLPKEGGMNPFKERAANRLADEATVLVRRGIIDSRSPAADALLDYREPPSNERADRMASLEAEVRRLQDILDECRELLRRAHGPYQTDSLNDAVFAMLAKLQALRGEG